MSTRGNIDSAQIRTAARNGAGTQVQMFGGGQTTSGHVAAFNANGDIVDGGAAGGGGSVTSVALTVPVRQSVAGSPVTTSGTLAITDNTQAANVIFAGPSSGAAAVPAFRAVVSADFPAAVVGGFQTPWLQNVNAAGYTLSNVPTVSGNGNITVAAGGAGTLALQTNAKTRISVDSAGHVTINAPDDSNATLTLNGSAASLTTQNALTLNVNTTFTANALSGMSFATGSPSLLQRMTLDASGHLVLAQPDDGAYGTGLSVNSYIRAAQFEAGSGQGVGVNLYTNGSGWIYRASAAGLLLVIGANGGVLYAAANGTGGANATINQMLSFPGATMTLAGQPFAQSIPSNTAAYDSNMPNNSAMMQASGGNTALIFRVKGSDGVMRQGSIAIS